MITYKVNKKAEVQKVNLNKKDYITMITMTIIYLVLALTNLGTLSVPETQWLPQVANESFIVDLGRKIDISRITYFCSLGESKEAKGEYSIEYLDESNNFVPLGRLEKDNVFIWKYIDVTASTRQLKFTVKLPGGAINEIGIFSRDSYTPLKINLFSRTENVGPVENLFDEQNKAAYMPSYLNGTYFDEIYHARTAYEYLNNIEPFELTHPPLGKVFISLGIIIFGMNPFGWRIVGTLFGAAMVPLMYIFGKKMFEKSFYAFCSAFLMMFDFMHFTQTRIATIDVYVTFFVILMYYYMYDYFVAKSYASGFPKSLKPLFLSGLFFGLGAASKWIALYGSAGLAMLFFISRLTEYLEYKKLSNNDETKATKWLKNFIPLHIKSTMIYCVLFFIIIPGGIYFFSYLPIVTIPGKGNWLIEIINNQKFMYTYHSTLTKTHPFASSWWQWPLILRPTWLYIGRTINDKISTISTMGNPAIWWTSILAVFGSLLIAIEKKDKKIFVIFIAIAFQYLPWVLVTRATWIYHFFSTVPFIILCTVYVIKYFLEKYPNIKYIIYTYLAIVFLLFIFFYPVISGMGVSSEYIHKLVWLPSWNFIN